MVGFARIAAAACTAFVFLLGALDSGGASPPGAAAERAPGVAAPAGTPDSSKSETLALAPTAQPGGAVAILRGSGPEDEEEEEGSAPGARYDEGDAEAADGAYYYRQLLLALVVVLATIAALVWIVRSQTRRR